MSSPAPQSFKVAGSIAAYRIVQGNGAHTVILASTSADAIIGVTVDNWDRAEAGAVSVQTHYGARVKLQFNDTVPADSLVESDSLGRGVAHTAVTAGSWVVGRLIGPAVAATGTIAEVLLQPQSISIP